MPGPVAIPQSQNLTLDSEDLSTASWTPQGLTSRTPNSGTTPAALGAQNRATTLLAAAGNSNHRTFQTTGTVVFQGDWIGCSAYVKAGTYTFGAIAIDFGTPQLINAIDLTTGAVTLQQATGMLFSRFVVQALDSGWWFLSAAAVPQISASTLIVAPQVQLTSNTGTPIWNAAGTETILAAGGAVFRANQAGDYARTIAVNVSTGPMRNSVA